MANDGEFSIGRIQEINSRDYNKSKIYTVKTENKTFVVWPNVGEKKGIKGSELKVGEQYIFGNKIEGKEYNGTLQYNVYWIGIPTKKDDSKVVKSNGVIIEETHTQEDVSGDMNTDDIIESEFHKYKDEYNEQHAELISRLMQCKDKNDVIKKLQEEELFKMSLPCWVGTYKLFVAAEDCKKLEDVFNGL